MILDQSHNLDRSRDFGPKSGFEHGQLLRGVESNSVVLMSHAAETTTQVRGTKTLCLINLYIPFEQRLGSQDIGSSRQTLQLHLQLPVLADADRPSQTHSIDGPCRKSRKVLDDGGAVHRLSGLVHGGDLVRRQEIGHVDPRRGRHVPPYSIGDAALGQCRHGRDDGRHVYGRLEKSCPSSRHSPVVHDSPVRPDLGHHLDTELRSSSRSRIPTRQI